MQRWEYCSLWRRAGPPERWYLTVYGAAGATEQELRADGDSGERSLRGAWGRTIAQLGVEGWELVAADAAGFYFKRPARRHTAPHAVPAGTYAARGARG